MQETDNMKEVGPSDMLIILAQYLAIHSTAKRYHWQVKWSGFMSDHLQFDRIAECYKEDLVDKIIEQYYMGIEREKIYETDYIVELSTKFEGSKLVMASEEDADVAMLNLKSLIVRLISAIEEVDFGNRGVNSELDNISSELTQCLGLINGRVQEVGVVERLKLSMKK